jgi:hypothetical protein
MDSHGQGAGRNSSTQSGGSICHQADAAEQAGRRSTVAAISWPAAGRYFRFSSKPAGRSALASEPPLALHDEPVILSV